MVTYKNKFLKKPSLNIPPLLPSRTKMQIDEARIAKSIMNDGYVGLHTHMLALKYRIYWKTFIMKKLKQMNKIVSSQRNEGGEKGGPLDIPKVILFGKNTDIFKPLEVCFYFSTNEPHCHRDPLLPIAVGQCLWASIAPQVAAGPRLKDASTGWLHGRSTCLTHSESAP